MPEGDAKLPLRFKYEDLQPGEFEELVYLLAHVADSAVIRTRAPDGGLDTVKLADGEPLVAAWGIQAKLYPEHIRWPDCRQSLDRAVSVWAARSVTFAFPRDLTAGQHRLFCKHLSDRHPGVAVDYWGASKLTGMLLASPASRGIAKRFFHLEDPVDLADRAIRSGRPLHTAEDLIEREHATTAFLRSADPHFDWVTTKGRRGTRLPPPQPGTALRMRFSEDDDDVIMDAVARSPVVPPDRAPRGSLELPDAESFERARQLLHAVATEGGRADLGDTLLRFEHVPAPFDELFTDPVQGRVSLRANRIPRPWAAAVLVSTDEGTAELDMDLHPEDPGEDWDARLVGHRHGLQLELQFVWSHSEQAGSVNVRWHFTRATGTAFERAHVLALLIALHGTGRFELRDRERHRPAIAEATKPAHVPDEIRLLQQVYEDLAVVESFAQSSFGPTPEEFTAEQARDLRWLAQALLDGGYTVTMRSATLRCGSEVVAGLRGVTTGIEIREVLHAQFFGHDLPVANRITPLPPMLVSETVRVPGPEAEWDVTLLPVTGDSVDVRITFARLESRTEQAA